jgi:hypothetical protein
MYLEDNKYNSQNDNYNYKLTIFRDICRKANILEHVKPIAYPIMLYRLALSYYYMKIDPFI